MIWPFLFEQMHFALHILAALVWFFAAWLYFDAWVGHKTSFGLLRWVGFGALALSFAVESVVVEQAASQVLLFTSVATIYPVVRMVGYGMIVASLLMDVIPRRIRLEDKQLVVVGSLAEAPYRIAVAGLPVGAAMTAALYLRRAITGLEHHLLPVAISFVLLTVAELCELGLLFRQTTNVAVYQLVAPYGILWFGHHLFLAASLAVLSKWVVWYLLKRFETQLFMFVTVTVVIVYLVTTATFTTVLLQTVARENLQQLDANVKVLSFGVERRQEELLSDVAAQVKRPDLAAALAANDRAAMSEFATAILTANRRSTVVIVDENGQVLARGEDAERYGDVLNDPLARLALDGNTLASFLMLEDVLGPTVAIHAAAPIVVDGTRRGALLLGTRVDSAFLDGFKKTTGLEGTLFGGNRISATTITTGDGVTRPVGVTISDPWITERVLKQGEAYTTEIRFANETYLGAFLPIKDIDSKAIGMFFVGKPQAELLSTAVHALQVTFGMAMVLLTVSLVPAFLMARSLSQQARV